MRKRLRIAIDARDLLVPQRTGVERVVHHFIESLNRVGHAAHDYRLLFDRPPPEHITRGLPGETLVVPVRYPRAQKVADVWIAWQIPRVAREQGLDAVITPNTKFPFGSVAVPMMMSDWLNPRPVTSMVPLKLPLASVVKKPMNKLLPEPVL